MGYQMHGQIGIWSSMTRTLFLMILTGSIQRWFLCLGITLQLVRTDPHGFNSLYVFIVNDEGIYLLMGNHFTHSFQESKESSTSCEIATSTIGGLSSTQVKIIDKLISMLSQNVSWLIPMEPYIDEDQIAIFSH